MNVKKQIDYWLTTARNDLETAEIIFKAGKNYHHCLFFCHLALEKGLKAIYVKTNKKIPPKTHDLEFLAQKSNLELAESESEFFATLTAFHIRTRYPDQRLEIYGRATRSYTAALLKETLEKLRWLENLAME
jgi:HEPN domain-containing protein